MSEKKTNILRVMLTKADRAAIDEAAHKLNLETSTFVRMKILELIRKDEKK